MQLNSEVNKSIFLSMKRLNFFYLSWNIFKYVIKKLDYIKWNKDVSLNQNSELFKVNTKYLMNFLIMK